MKYKNWKSKKESYYYANDLENEETIENKFKKIYRENLWEIDETKSGVASQKGFAISALSNLEKIIKQYVVV